jgi:hypothetical protein
MGINYHSLGGWSSWQLAIALQAATTATNLDIARRSGLNPSSKSDPSSSFLQKQLQKKMDFSIQVFFCGSIWPLPKATVGSQYSQALHENRLVVRPPSVAGRFPAEGVKGGT